MEIVCPVHAFEQDKPSMPGQLAMASSDVDSKYLSSAVKAASNSHHLEHH